MIIHGDCLEVMTQYPDNHFSAMVTDPPYGLKFMGKQWDHGIPGVEFWQEALRVAKPGSFLLAFGGTRTFHRLTCSIEDAGWEIRDCLMWLYGSGFPKSHNHFGIDGYGTALKPAWEPIIMAMKPCDGTFAQNAEKWGVAGINIDVARIEGKRWPANILFDESSAAMLDEQSGISKSPKSGIRKASSEFGQNSGWNDHKNIDTFRLGHNDSGGASRFFYCAKASSSERNEGCGDLPLKEKKTLNDYASPGEGRTASKSGAPCKNNHPTVKPLKLMEYLIKLVMPPKDGILLDPFAGSGTTIVAAKNLGYEAVGIELEQEYCEIANKRIESVKNEQQLALF